MSRPPTGVYRAVVKAVDGAQVKVTVTRLGGASLYTARLVLPVGAPDAALGATDVAVGDASLALRPLQVDDEVLVAFLEGDRDHVIVLGRLA
jgi:hypothetical protein